MTIIDLYRSLIQTLRLVASPSSIQIALLPKFVNVPDEIALLYNDAYSAVPQLKEVFSFSPEALDLLKDLDDMFDKMSEGKTLWTIEKLKEDNYWQASRELALKVLKQLNEHYDKPNLDFVGWIE